MNHSIARFLHVFPWYRQLSLDLLNEMPEDHLQKRLCGRTLTMAVQFIDLGDFQLKVIDMLSGSSLRKQCPAIDPHNSAKKEIITYLERCSKIAANHLKAVNESNGRVDWYGRMNFDLTEALGFILAHEAMHHGEIMSYISAHNLPMPKALQNTWGFEREEKIKKTEKTKTKAHSSSFRAYRQTMLGL